MFPGRRVTLFSFLQGCIIEYPVSIRYRLPKSPLPGWAPCSPLRTMTRRWINGSGYKPLRAPRMVVIECLLMLMCLRCRKKHWWVLNCSSEAAFRCASASGASGLSREPLRRASSSGIEVLVFFEHNHCATEVSFSICWISEYISDIIEYKVLIYFRCTGDIIAPSAINEWTQS